MERAAILEVLADQRKIRFPKEGIERECFRDFQLKEKNPFVQIFSGVRRCGKSMTMQWIREQAAEKDYYLDFDDERLIDFQLEDFQKLYEIFLENFGEQKTFYFDEVQNVKGWERFVRRLHSQGNKIYITGSNASLLSRELGTHLTGRYTAAEIYPFSFREYLRFLRHDFDKPDFLTSSQRAQIKKHFSAYRTDGGFPEYLTTKKSDYLKQLYENIIYKDILVRYKLPHEHPLRELALHSASNIGKTISYNQMKGLLGLGSATTIKEYLSYFENSFLFFSLNKFDYSLKKQIYAPKKVYCIDNGLAGEIGFRFSQDAGRYLENLVFIELRRKRKKIYYHQNKNECDFIIQQGNKITEAIQVSSTLGSALTRDREVKGLCEALETHGLKHGLILNDHEEGEEQILVAGKKRTIRILPVWKWLIGGD